MTQSLRIDDPAALTRHIESRDHARHRELLPALAALTEKVEPVYFGEDCVPEGLSDLLQRMIGAPEVHMKKEELILFPAIRRGGGLGIGTPIAVMRADHDHHSRDVAKIQRLTDGLSMPERACRTWTALYAGLGEFHSDLAEHIRLQNDVLFPPFETEAANV